HEVALFEDIHHQVLQEFPDLEKAQNRRRLLFETIRRMLSAQVYDLIAVSQVALAAAMPPSPDAVRQLPPLLAFGSAMRLQSIQLKQFLFRNLYRHPQVMETTALAKQVVRDLFDAYLSAPHELPLNFGVGIDDIKGGKGRPPTPARLVADYIAGMTDRFAAREHERLTGHRLLG
ncbi:MAG: deoxyguanosinetriphosphate triphosphohydrolase, partial [Burkholderiales bacterium]